MSDFFPFKNDEQSWSVGLGDGLTFNNGLDSISIYGEVRFELTEKSISLANELLVVLKDIELKTPQTDAKKSLWCKKHGKSLVIGGDVEIGSNAEGKVAIQKAIEALEEFTVIPLNPLKI